MHENEISFQIRKAAYEIHTDLGPGLMESVYETALAYELQQQGLHVARQVPMSMVYKGIALESAYRLDLVVGQKVVVELKSVDVLVEVHFKQLMTYLTDVTQPIWSKCSAWL